MYDVAVIGGGVIGGLIARELSKYELSVCILEKEADVSMGASKANSGIVHAGHDAKPGTQKARFNLRGAVLMEQLCRDLDVKYKKNGSLVIAFSDEEAKTLQTLYKRGITNGVQELEILDAKELRRREPNLSDEIISALYAPGGIVCPYKLTIAAIGCAMDNGAELKLNFSVTEINKTDYGYELCSGSETVRAKFVINAAGVHSDEIAAMAGDKSFTIKPRRGNYMILDKERETAVSHTIFRVPNKMGKGILVSPTVDQNLLLGPTSADIDDKSDTSTNADDLDSIWQNAVKVVPGLLKNKTITSFSGIRATPSGEDFIINRPFEKWINAAGIESPGLTSAPAIAEYITELLKESGVPMLPKKTFSPKRKIVLAPKEKYHKIICRCETVSEGEILEAIRSNPRAVDIDGVKRRVRAGMGRCQGGFCMPYVAELLAAENKLSLDSVTKCGNGSEILSGRAE